jgi:hypothetical protein
MPAESTYTPINTFTVTGSTSIITFASIPQTYTDLRIVGYIRSSASGASTDLLDCSFNSVESGGTYSTTILQGNGSAASTSLWGSVNVGYRFAQAPASTATANIFGSFTADLNNYSNTTTFKTMLTQSACDLNGSGVRVNTVMLSRNTPAISNIKIFFDTGALFVIGSTITLYGIKAA